MPPKMYIELEVDNKGLVTIKQAGKEIGKVSDEANKKINRMRDSWGMFTRYMQAAAGLWGASEIVRMTIDLGKMGAEVNNVSRAFSRLGDAPDLLDKLKSASRNTIPELELMRTAITGIDLGATNDQMEIFTRFARFESVRKGKDELQTLQDILGGVLRGSTELLDNFGISLTAVNKKIEEMAEESGTVANKLSAVERRILMVEAATQLMNERMEEFGDMPLTDAEKIAQAAAQWQNLRNNIATMVSPAVVQGFEVINTALEHMLGQMERYEKMGFSPAVSAGLTLTGMPHQSVGNYNAMIADQLGLRSYVPPEDLMGPFAEQPKPDGEGDGGGGGLDGDGGDGGNSRDAPGYQDRWVHTPWGFEAVRVGKSPNLEDMRQAERMGFSGDLKKGKDEKNPIIGAMGPVEDEFEVVFGRGEQMALTMTDSVGQAFMALGNQIGAEFQGLWSSIFNTGDSMFGRLAASFLGTFTQTVVGSFAQMGAGMVMNMILPGSGALLGGFMAEGGPVVPNRPYIVGEKGPEMFVPQTRGKVVPNYQLNFYESNQFGTGPGVEETARTVQTTRANQREELRYLLNDMARKNRLGDDFSRAG